MSREPGVIELGLYQYDPRAGPELDVADRLLPDRERIRLLVTRWWRPALVLAMVTGLLGGAAVPRQPLLVTVWTVPDAATHRLAAVGGSLYVAGATGGESSIRAYRLADGAPLWETVVENPGDWIDLTVAGEVPLVVTPRPGSIEVVTAHDPLTGEVLWSHRGWPLVTTLDPGRVLLTQQVPSAWPADDGTRPGDGAHAYQAAMIDLRTGEAAWTRRFPPGEVVLGGAHGVSRLLTLNSGGRLTRYHLDTGAVLASRQTPAGTGQPSLLGTVTQVVVGEASLTVLPMAGSHAYLEPGRVVLGEPAALAA